MGSTERERYNPRRHWLRLGWWEVYDEFGGFLAFAPNLFSLRCWLGRNIPAQCPHLVVRTGPVREQWRDRARVARIVSRSGRIIMGRMALLTQDKGGT